MQATDIIVEGAVWCKSVLASLTEEEFVGSHKGIDGLYPHLTDEEKEKALRKAWELCQSPKPKPEKESKKN